MELNFGKFSRRTFAAEKALKDEKIRSASALLDMEMKLDEANQARKEAEDVVAEARSVAIKAQDVAAAAMLSEEAARANLATAKAEIKALEEAAASGETSEQGFDLGFFEGYADLKWRVALDHPEWDLSGYSGVDLNFFDVEEDEPAPEGTAAGPTDEVGEVPRRLMGQRPGPQAKKRRLPHRPGRPSGQRRSGTPSS